MDGKPADMEAKIDIGNICSLCQVAMPDEKTKQSHLLGKKHQLAVHMSHVNEMKQKCGVFISGFPNLVSKEVITEFIKSLGRTKDIFIDDNNRYALVQFRNLEIAQELITRQTIPFLNSKLSVKQRIIRENNQGADPIPDPFEELYPALKDVSNLDDQINIVMNILQPPRSILVQYTQLCKDLQGVLSRTFPSCRVYPFGSTVTALDFKTSDVDAYVYVPPEESLQSDRSMVQKARNALGKTNLFSRIIAIPKAKTPIVKCVHTPTNISCDFNFKNMLGVCNSRLINFFLSQDRKLRPAMVVLKSWGKSHSLIGPSGKFSSYAFTMLFIFYLQQENYFPPISELQYNLQFQDVQENWNGGFDPNFQYNKDKLQYLRISDLLYQFFIFYRNFNFSINVVSTFCQRILLKTDFLKPNCLPHEFARYYVNAANTHPLKVETPICVQDPFEQNHNVTRAVSTKILDEFIYLCKYAVEIFKPNVDESLFLLFTEEYEQPNEHPKYKCTATTCKFKVQMGECLAYLQKTVTDEKEKSVESAWYHMLNEFFISVFIRVLKFDVTIIKDDDISTSKSIKLDGQSDVHDSIPADNLKLLCEGKFYLWQGRNTIMRDLTYDEEDIKTNLDKQIYISNYMHHVLLKDVNVDECIFKFYLTMTAISNPTTSIEFIVERLMDNNKGGVFPSFSSFVAVKVPQWFAMHEQELNKNVKQIAKADEVIEIKDD